jgi:kynurenine formamidase
MPFRNRSVTTIIALVFATLFSVANAGEKTSLWKIQETLAAKTYVDPPAHFIKGLRTVCTMMSRKMQVTRCRSSA